MHLVNYLDIQLIYIYFNINKIENKVYLITYNPSRESGMDLHNEILSLARKLKNSFFITASKSLDSSA
jgi:hypothetical protein